MMYADLHLHSTASDGLLTPTELVTMAKSLGFSAVALTDHDTISGIAEAKTAGVALGIEVIAGIELSAIDDREYGEVEVHILGYLIDPEHKSLHEVLKLIIESRRDRAIKMVKKLNKLGILISLDNVREIAVGESLGRPHIARAMFEAGYISEIREAFSKDYIGRGGLAYVERFKISPREAIELINGAGGVAVLAHPGYLSDGTSLGEEDIYDYCQAGLQGLEVFYSRHSQEQQCCYKKIAKKFNLLVTGGSDFHGGNEVLLGSVKISFDNVKALKNAI